MRHDALDARLPKRPLRGAVAVLAAVCAGLLALASDLRAPQAPAALLPAHQPTFHERVAPHARTDATPDSALLSAEALRAVPASQRSALVLSELS
jgi:hypothetical protein